MDPRLFSEWAQIDDRLRRAIIARDAGEHAPSTRSPDCWPQASRDPNSTGAVMASLLFIVSRTESGTYTYLRHALAKGSGDVIVDRRQGERRRVRQDVTCDRRYGDRRHRDVTGDLQTSGWALVHR